MRTAAALGLLALVAGCGNGPEKATRSPCPAVRGAGPGRLEHRELNLVACRYGAARVRFDTAPQAAVRWSRQQVELMQNTGSDWHSNPTARPRLVPGLGQGAFYVPDGHEVVATDGRRIVTVALGGGGDASRARAVGLARAALAAP